MVSPSLFVEDQGELIGLDNGYYKNAFLSHAHSDHLKGIKRVENLIASEETKVLAGLSKNEYKSKNIKMVSAGHILGAKQIVVENGKKVVYTGDFRLKDGIIEKGGEIVECDKLIIDGTYSKKEFSFPDPFEVYEEIKRNVLKELLEGRGVIFAAYSLGKSQEIIKVLNEVGIVPIVEDKTYYFSKKYKELGVEIEFFREEEGEEITREPFVYMSPPRKVNKETVKRLTQRYGILFRRYIATGWVRKYKFSFFNKKFPLSDHADYKDVKRYIEESNAKEVLVFSTNETDLIREFKDKIRIKVI